MPPSTEGKHTVILARAGAGGDDDTRLLRAMEEALDLPEGHLEAHPGMAQPEFRLAEGIDGATAHRLAEVAQRLGYEPRVRERLGIRYSNRRSPWPHVLTFGLLSLFVLGALRWIGPLAGPVGSSLTAVLMLTAGLAVLRNWRQSIQLPLVTPTHRLLASRPVGDAMVEATQAAREALAHLRSAVDGGEVPEPARGALRDTVVQLRARVDQLQAEVERLPTAAVSAVAALEQRLAGMTADAPGRATLQAALNEEQAAMALAEERRSEVIAELLAVRRAATEGAHSLVATPERGADEVIERVRKQVGAVRKAQAELHRR